MAWRSTGDGRGKGLRGVEAERRDGNSLKETRSPCIGVSRRYSASMHEGALLTGGRDDLSTWSTYPYARSLHCDDGEGSCEGTLLAEENS